MFALVDFSLYIEGGWKCLGHGCMDQEDQLLDPDSQALTNSHGVKMTFTG